MRGPQAAGVLLGPKDLCAAAFWNAAPHHNWGRALKVGKEEAMGKKKTVEGEEPVVSKRPPRRGNKDPDPTSEAHSFYSNKQMATSEGYMKPEKCPTRKNFQEKGSIQGLDL